MSAALRPARSVGVFYLALFVAAAAAGQPERPSAVPAWDARGLGPLPWQAIACLDMTDDGSFLAVGTIAPPGDPNVMLLSGDGKLLRTFEVGQRWIDQVSVAADGSVVWATCGTPEGRPPDGCTLFACAKDVVALPRPKQSDVFHYGQHSNHSGSLSASYAQGAVAVMGDQVTWLGTAASSPTARLTLPQPDGARTVSFAADRSGIAVLGYTATVPDSGPPGPNLAVVSPESRAALWTRPAVVEVDRAEPIERGRYGTPTLPDGRCEEVLQADERVVAPLSVAIVGDDATRRVAAADYPGWRRRVRSTATMQWQDGFVRFVPARPAVTVYDADGKPIRRFAPEQFPKPGWFSLAFLPGGKRLVAWPRAWTSRGLAGQPRLPVDENASTLYLLDVGSGTVRAQSFPDAISDLAVSASGAIAVGCWNGKAYLLDPARPAGDSSATVDPARPAGQFLTTVDVGGPSLVRLSSNGQRILVAAASGSVRLFSRDGRETWHVDLNQAVPRAEKPWVAKAKLGEIAPGVWQMPGGRYNSDMGGQRLLQAPDGLILIEAHAGLSFESEFAAIKAAGLDPMKVTHVLLTHEHGDHAPGAYLWRVVTGARVAASVETAYFLQHHIPEGSGYGFHPPNPVDIRVDGDTDLELSGLKVRAVRLPGHTYGSLGWSFEKDGKRYVALGDLIMPSGVLGYSGSPNFSARDALSSLRKLEAMGPLVAVPGHGSVGDAAPLIRDGIEVGVHVGWGKMPPEKPDPYFRIAQKNVRVVAWNIGITAADFGDVNNDGAPDVAVLVPAEDGCEVQVFLNRAGRFSAQPEQRIAVAGLSEPGRLRMRRLNDDAIGDFLVSGKEAAALLLSKNGRPEYDLARLGVREANQARLADLTGTGRPQILVASAFALFQAAVPQPAGWRLASIEPSLRAAYGDFYQADLSGDGRQDLVASDGAVFFRGADGKLPAEPSVKLPPPAAEGWTFLAVGDFNADGRPDVALLSSQVARSEAALFYNTGDKQAPLPPRASAVLPLFAEPPAAGKAARRTEQSLLRDTPTVADYNGDGVVDLVFAQGQDNRVHVLLGGPQGLSASRRAEIALDYRLHHLTGVAAADFNGDGVCDLAALGYTQTGVGSGGPLAVYLYLQER